MSQRVNVQDGQLIEFYKVNGNKLRAVSGLKVAFLFRAVANPLKGPVEIEGLRNILGGLRANKWDGCLNAALGRWPTMTASSTNDPINVILVSASPEANDDFEMPFGSFNGLKREEEQLLKDDFPSLTYAILQMSRYEDIFVEESLNVLMDEGDGGEDKKKRR